jgi:hypothetical protein
MFAIGLSEDIMRQIVFVVFFASAVIGCAERGSPVEPATTRPSPMSIAAGGPPVETVDSYVSTTCGFEILVEANGKLKEIPLPGGRVKVLFPAFRGRLTNVATGKQVSLSITGSFHITAIPNGDTEIVYTGRNTFDDPFAGRFLLLIGHFREVFDQDFNPVVPLGGTGRMVDVCQLLG